MNNKDIGLSGKGNTVGRVYWVRFTNSLNYLSQPLAHIHDMQAQK
jgi:hypothetical protein